MAWTEFIAALGVFLLSHAVPVRAPVKPWLVGLVGQRGFTIAYSLLSLALLAWLITAAGRAPFVMVDRCIEQGHRQLVFSTWRRLLGQVIRQVFGVVCRQLHDALCSVLVCVARRKPSPQCDTALDLARGELSIPSEFWFPASP